MKYVTVVYAPGKPKSFALIGSTIDGGGEAPADIVRQCRERGLIVERRSLLSIRVQLAPQAARSALWLMLWRLTYQWPRMLRRWLGAP